MAYLNRSHDEYGNSVFEKYNALNNLYDFINIHLALTPEERLNWQQISHLYLRNSGKWRDYASNKVSL